VVFTQWYGPAYVDPPAPAYVDAPAPASSRSSGGAGGQGSRITAVGWRWRWLAVDVGVAERHRGVMTTEADVRSIALGLPGVTERPSWGRPAWFARSLMARMWDDDVLTVKSHERDVLAAAEPETYYWTDHHDRSPVLVLVRLARIDREELAELLRESHRIAGGG
jgi:hypothetical protein